MQRRGIVAEKPEIRELPEGARQPLAESELTLEQLAEGCSRIKSFQKIRNAAAVG